MIAKISTKVCGLLSLVIALAVGAVDSPGVAAAPAAPQEPKPEAIPGAEKAEEVITALPAEAATEAVPAEAASEEVIIGVPVEAPPAEETSTELPPLKGPKKSIAVLDFENRSGFEGEWNLGEGMAEMLTTGLVETDRFIVVERLSIQRILEEQNLRTSLRAARVTVARRKLVPAQIGVTGAVTEFSFEKQKTGAAHVGINLRMVETSTGEVLFSERFEKKATYTGIEADYTSKDFGIGGEHFGETPLGKATQEVINDAVHQIAVNMEQVPWRGNILLVQGERVYANCGKREGIVPGQKFVVYSKGPELTDPETGEILGVEETRAGTISVVEVKDKYSIARIQEGGNFKRGDILRLQ